MAYTINLVGDSDDSQKVNPSIRKDLILPRPYLFIHIPKSGGTSLGRVAELAENGGGEKFIRFWHHPVKPEVIQEMLLHNFVFGHFKYGIHQHFKQNCTYMTMLRNPVDRVISHYYYHLKSETDRFHALAANNPIETWVTLSFDANNDHVQFISGKHGIPSEKEFQQALRNLHQFGFVGIYERFDESMVLLKYYAGFKNVFYNYTKSVVGRPKMHDLTPEVIEKIKEYNKYDLLLYEEGKKIFENQIKRAGPDFWKEVKNFKKEEAEYQKKFQNGCVDCLR